MIKVNFQAPSSEEWTKWCNDALKASEQLLNDYAQGKKIKIKEDLYKRRREDIWAAFSGKCAYCEVKMVLSQTGDVEHFRPKGGVTDDSNKPISYTDENGAPKPHPGYFWLAYDVSNLLPSCALCNRPTKAPGGKVVGKWNRFPVDGKRAFRPQDLGTEKPLLLNPLTDDPADHIDLDVDTGLLFAKTPRGQTCIDVLGLNRDGLPEARRDAYDNILARAGEQNSALRNNDAASAQKHADFLLMHKSGKAPLSMAGRKALEKVRQLLMAQLAALTE